MEKPRLVQVLCGPARHCIMALPYQPGITAAQRDFGSTDDITLTRENAVEYLRGMVDGLIARKAIDPWCGLCKSKRDRWFLEDAAMRFNSLEEAMPHLRALEIEQVLTTELTRSFFDRSKN